MKKINILQNTSDNFECDLFLCHSKADKDWVEELATKIESEAVSGRRLRVFFDPWDVNPGENVVIRLEKGVSKARFVGVVLSPEMLLTDWPTMEWTMAVYDDPSGRKGKVLPFLRRNCDIPPSLRIRNWLDFRTPEKQERSYSKLLALLKGTSLPRGESTLDKGPLSPTVGSPEYFSKPLQFADATIEQLVSNLLPVKSYPPTIWQSNTSARWLSQVYLHLEKFGQTETTPTFALKQNSLYSFWDPRSRTCPFRGLISGSIDDRTNSPEDWAKDTSKRDLLLEMMNRALRHHCRWLGLQSDEKRNRWYFPPENHSNRVVEWDTGKRKSKRTVVREYTKKSSGETFWAHLTVIPRFIQLGERSFLRLEPSWTFTTDGFNPFPKEKRTSISTKWMYNEYNPSVFYHLRFWTFILARGRQNILIDTGNSNLEIFGTPATTDSQYGIEGDHLNADKMYEVAETEVPPVDYLVETRETPDL